METSGKWDWVVQRPKFKDGGWIGVYIAYDREDAVRWMNANIRRNLRAWCETTGEIVAKGGEGHANG